MQKYQEMFLKRYQDNLGLWKEKLQVSNQELYRFLHSIKGTASSIGLHELSTIATQLIERLDVEDNSIWEEEQWSNFIQPLALLLQGEGQSPVVIKEEQSKINSEQQIILLVDSDIEFVNYLKGTLENNYSVLVATNIDRAVQMFYDYHPDLIIIDYYVKNSKGLELLDKVAHSVNQTFTPILFTSTEDVVEYRKNVYAAGALDFIVKATQLEVITSLIENRLNLKQSLNKQIMIDPLTNAYNRAFLYTSWKRVLKNYRERKLPFSLALIDLDNFKQVNDKYGHTVGDQVLSSFSKLIFNEKHSDDSLVRYGGEEFILIMPNQGQNQALNYVSKLLEKFKSLEHTTEDVSFQLSFTAGITEMDDKVQSMDQIIEQSDQALYYGKNNGKKSVHTYSNHFHSVMDLTKNNQILNIAIVDDDAVIQQLLTDRLSRLNVQNYSIEVQAFREGETFMETNWYKKAGKHIILLDGIMPRMDGLEVLAKLRAMDNERDMAIVMLTGRQKDKDIVKALELGADDYITKPFSLQELEARIKRLVHRLF